MPSMNPQDMSAARNSGALPCGAAHDCQTVDQKSSVNVGKEYWRSVEDFVDTPEFRNFVHQEFPAGAAEMLNSSDRRQFLKIMGASMALAGMGMAGCRRWPEERIAPYANRPANHDPASTNQFATCMDLCGVAQGLLVTSYDFRPIKIEGNPQHPLNQGATDVYAQASILDLYDPDRSRGILHNSEHSDWAALSNWAKDHFAGLRNAQGSGFAILSEASSSVAVASMKRRVLEAFPNAKWHEYEALNNDQQINGSRLAFGAPHRVHYSFDKARTVVSLDSDFLHCGSEAVKWARDFAKARKPSEDRTTMNRLYAFESSLSLTGANADHRVAMLSAEVAVVAARLAAAIVPGAESVLQPVTANAVAGPNGEKLAQVLEHAIADLRSAQGASIIIAGPRQPAEVHYLAHLMNEILGNNGRTVFYTPLPDVQPHVESLRALASEISAGNVNTLLILGGNPAYNAPADVRFAELLKNVQNTIHVSEYVDETSSRCAWHINRAHYLEAWGDGRAFDGTISLAQPLIDAIFSGKSVIEVLSLVLGESKSGYDIVRQSIQEMGSGGDFDAFWRKALHDGFIPNTAIQPVNARVNNANLGSHATALAQKSAAASGKVEIVFITDNSTFDGRFANNGWMQELPDPLTKLTWDNAAIMSPSMAASLGVKNGSMVSLRLGEQSLDAAVIVLPGHAGGSVSIALGYGREFEGRICKGAGFNAYRLRTSDAMGFGFGTVTVISGHYPMAITQDHHAPDTTGGKGTQERLPTLFREANLGEYQSHPDFVKHRTHVVHRLSLWDEKHPFHDEGQNAPYAWAMSIDLTACTGCSACVIACQAENNIPIVGKDQVMRSREMHWLRVDRYFKGTNMDSPDSVMLAPIPCMHCENAPCEQVCPVAATTHDEQGLNVMVYNRCIGTRYCSNNCPYKVRRFNYYDFHTRAPHREQPGVLLQVEPEYYTKSQTAADPLRQLQFNPEVSVRMRGIMEKCTYCVQRISKARIEAKNNWARSKRISPDASLDSRVPIEDGSFTTACAQACPTNAIVFGDLNNPKSKVAQLHKHERTYEMLEEINTKPRTRYMAKIRNPAASASTTTNDHGHG